MVPVPTGLAADLIGSLDHPMTASDPLLAHYVPDPDGGLTSIEDAVAWLLLGAPTATGPCAGGPASPGRQRPAVGRRGCAAHPAGCRRGDTADGAAGARVVMHGPWTRRRRGANGPGHPHRPRTEAAARVTAPGAERRGLLNEIGAAITNVAVPHHEPPAVVLCRRIVVVIVVVIGAALLGFPLSPTPGESSSSWLTFALAAVWTVGAKLTSESASRAGAHAQRGKDQQVSHANNKNPTDKATADATSAFCADYLGDLDTSPTPSSRRACGKKGRRPPGGALGDILLRPLTSWSGATFSSLALGFGGGVLAVTRPVGHPHRSAGAFRGTPSPTKSGAAESISAFEQAVRHADSRSLARLSLREVVPPGRDPALDPRCTARQV